MTPAQTSHVRVTSLLCTSSAVLTFQHGSRTAAPAKLLHSSLHKEAQIRAKLAPLWPFARAEAAGGVLSSGDNKNALTSCALHCRS